MICKSKHLNMTEYFLVKKDFLATSSHHTCLALLLFCINSLKIRSLLSYPRQNVQTRHGWFLQQRIFTNGKYLQKDKIPHVSEDWKINLQVKERGLNFEERSGCSEEVVRLRLLGGDAARLLRRCLEDCEVPLVEKMSIVSGGNRNQIFISYFAHL